MIPLSACLGNNHCRPHLFCPFITLVFQDKLYFLANHLILGLEILFKNRIFIPHKIQQTLSLRLLLKSSTFVSNAVCHLLGIGMVSALPHPCTTYPAPAPCAAWSTYPASSLSANYFLLLSSMVRAHLQTQRELPSFYLVVCLLK